MGKKIDAQDEFVANDSLLICQNKKNQSMNCKKDRVAIFVSNWVEALKNPNGISDCVLKSWRLGSLVFRESDIERLIQAGAPIKVYVEEDANRGSKESG